jgi:hypothetical protein
VNIEEGQQSANSGGVVVAAMSVCQNVGRSVQKLDSESIPTHIDNLRTLLIRIGPCFLRDEPCYENECT